MTSETTYDFLVGYLSDILSNTDVTGLGARDERVNKLTEADLCDIFERYIYREGEPFFLMEKSGRMIVFNGKYYEAAERDTLSQVVKRAMEKLDIGKVYQKNSYKKIAEECITAMSVCEKNEFKPDRRYISFENGIYDLEQRSLMPFNDKYRTDLHLDFDFVPGKKSLLWDTKLCEIIPDGDMRDALQKFFGCLLLNRDESKVEYVCFLLGPGGNGKSVLVDAVVNTFGNDLFSKFSPEDLFRSQQRMFNLAELDGKIANFCDDVSNKDFSGGDFKSFVSGAEFQARMPYGQNFFKVKAPLLICCANEIPPSTDDTEGFHRRFLTILSCDKSWTGADKDPKLTYKLRTTDERQAIFNWVLEGYYKVIDDGGDIKFGDSVIETQKSIRMDSNSVRRWIRDMNFEPSDPVSKTGDGWKTLVEWYNDYKLYCDSVGERSPQKAKTMSNVMRQMGFAREKRNTGMWYYMTEAKPKKEDAVVNNEEAENMGMDERSIIESLPF